MKRVLALAAALLMIAGALVVRNRVIDDDGASGGKRGGGGGKGDGNQTLVIGCVAELLDACRSLSDVRVEEVNPGDALAQAVADEIDAWVTFDPWPEMVQVAGDQRPYGTTSALGQQQISVLIGDERRDTLAGACDGELDWSCVRDNAGDPWTEIDPATDLGGSYRLGLGDQRSALGQLLVGHVVGATTTIEEDGIEAVETAVVRQALDSADPDPTTAQLSAIATVGFGEYSAVVSSNAAAETIARTQQATAKGLVVVTPEPVGLIRVVVAQVRAGEDAADTVAPLREVLGEQGWSPSTDASTNLPDADLLVALGERLSQ